MVKVLNLCARLASLEGLACFALLTNYENYSQIVCQVLQYFEQV